jgi:hypothetical protein
MECKKCPYFESKKEVINNGKVVVGFCKLRGKNMTDLTIRNDLCKDRAIVEIPANAKVVKFETKADVAKVEFPQNAHIVPREKPAINVQEATKAVDQQKTEEKPKKPLSQNSGESEEQFIRRAVWG